jgi:hypothetical protein
MKNTFALMLLLTSTALFAAAPEFDNITKADLEKVGNEFAMTFSHTTVSAPETEGVWGVEVGVLGGQSATPNLKRVVEASGGEGKDFKNLYHAGVFARVHLPLEFFLEGSYLPEVTISDVDVNNKTIGAGWNAGGFFGLPLDLAIGASMSQSDLKYDQVLNNSSTFNQDVNSKVKLNSSSQIYWVGISKRLGFFTPYVKYGQAHSESDVKLKASVGSIFAFDPQSQNETVSKDGSYLAAGANISFFFFRLGAEYSEIASVRRATAKLSVDF